LRSLSESVSESLSGSQSILSLSSPFNPSRTVEPCRPGFVSNATIRSRSLFASAFSALDKAPHTSRFNRYRNRYRSRYRYRSRFLTSDARYRFRNSCSMTFQSFTYAIRPSYVLNGSTIDIRLLMTESHPYPSNSDCDSRLQSRSRCR
jgi:hypothetical protein